MDGRYKELTNKAFNLHKNNQFEEAEKIYTLLLQINPNDINVLNLYAMLCTSLNKYKEAIDVLTKAYILNPDTLIGANLAKAYFLDNQIDNAIKIFESELKNKPSDDIYYSLGIAYKKKKDFKKAIESYKNAVKFNPNHYSSLYNLANLYISLKMNNEAKEYGLRAAAVKPEDASIHTLLAEIYEGEKDYNNAAAQMEKAFNINNRNYLYAYNLAVYYSKLNKRDKAVSYYNIALKINPGHVSSLLNLASIYKDENKEISLKLLIDAYRHEPDNENVCLSLAQTHRDLYNNEKSIQVLEKYLEKHPDCAQAYSILGTNCMDKGLYSEALTYYEKALSLDTKNLNYLHCKASALKYLGRIDDAQKLFEQIVSDANASTQSKLTLGMIYLQKKDFNRGMQLYGLRYLETKMPEKLKEKIWNKSLDISDKDVLLYSNCGLGDTIMYSRYIPYLKKMCKSLIIQTDAELIDILKRNYPDIKIISKAQTIGKFDILLQMMDIAYALNMDFDNIPLADGYLNADENKVIEYKKLNLFDNSKLKVGIFYQGNKRVFRNRAVPFEYLNSLNSISNIQLYSFQISDNGLESESVINLSKYINNYDDTAALLKCIDVLITIDSSIVHMAGALSVNTMLMLPNVSEWRWFNDTDNTPWYNSVKIVKQAIPFDWTKEIEQIKFELLKYENKRQI